MNNTKAGLIDRTLDNSYIFELLVFSNYLFKVFKIFRNLSSVFLY